MVKCLFRMPCAVNYLALWHQTTASEIFLSPVKPRKCVGIIVFLVAKHWKGMFIQSSGVLGVLCIGGLMWFVYRRFSQLLPICFGHHCSFQILHTQDMPRWSMPLKLIYNISHFERCHPQRIVNSLFSVFMSIFLNREGFPCYFPHLQNLPSQGCLRIADPVNQDTLVPASQQKMERNGLGERLLLVCLKCTSMYKRYKPVVAKYVDITPRCNRLI